MMTRAWDRQPNESTPAYEAFALYRDMGEGRSLNAVAQKLSKSEQLLKRWSSGHRWVERVAAWDAYIDQQAQKKVVRAAVDRKAAMLQRHAMAGRALQSFGLKYIEKHQMVDRSGDAINAILRGVEIERKSEALPDYLFEVINADDSEILRNYHELLAQVGRAGSGDETAGDTDSGTAESPAADAPAD